MKPFRKRYFSFKAGSKGKMQYNLGRIVIHLVVVNLECSFYEMDQKPSYRKTTFNGQTEKLELKVDLNEMLNHVG